MKMKIIIFFTVALCAVVQAEDVKNCCMCHIRMADEPTGKDLIMDVFQNDIKIDACNDATLEQCKKFCLDTEKEKTNGDLSVVSKISKVPYGDILCKKVDRDVENKMLKLVSEVKCGSDSKMMETGLEFGQKLTCKDKNFIKM